MLWLGILRDSPDNITFKLLGSESLAPATVQLTARDSGGFAQDVSMSRGADDAQYIGTWDTTGRELGLADVEASAEDLSGNLSAVEGELDLVSSYGRHYGQQYGRGC